MVMPITQKSTAGGKAVPVFWRDCAWRVRIFVHTRIGKHRVFSASVARRFLSAGRLSANGQPDRVAALKIFTFDQTRICDRRNVRSAAFSLPRFRLPRRADTLVRSKLERQQSFRKSPNGRLHGNRSGQECSRVSGDRPHMGGRVSLQPKRCDPMRSQRVAERLGPVLDFAASHLGGLASHLRIYSVFEHPHNI
jgi:hypothetical protein